MTTASCAPAPLTWDDAFRLYEDYLHARRASRLTVYDRRRDLRLLRDALSPHAASPTHVRLDHLRRYQLQLLNKPLAASTVAKVTSHIRSFFSFLYLEERLPKNPAGRLEPPRVPPRLPGHVVTADEMTLLLDAAKTTKTPLLDRALLEVLYSTGLRRAELLALDLFDVDRRERTLLVRAGKGEKPRLLPIPPTCYDALTRYLEFGRPEHERAPTPALFLGPRGKRLSKCSLARILHDLTDRAGIDKRITPHCFRRALATGLLKNGTNLKVIQTILGHSDLSTTSVYLCLSPDEIRHEVLSRHPRERFE